MTDDAPLVTRTVTCPRCRADATLSYVVAHSTLELASCADSIVYLCPNMCTFSQGEITALLDREA